MIDYTLYLDTTGGKDENGFFEIGVIQLSSMDSEFIDGNYRVERRGFGDIDVKNEPYNYLKLGGDRYLLYDIISSVPASQEIHLKFVSTYETLYAYFGVIDCQLDNDKKVIKIKTYILDQYTDLLDNRDTEIKLFDETNQIINGDFSEWSGSLPFGWTKIHPDTEVERSYFKDGSAILLPVITPTPITYQGGITQTIPDVLANKQIQLSFLYSLIGTLSYRYDLYFKVVLTGSLQSYDLTPEGKWALYNSGYYPIYKAQVLPLDIGSAEYSKFSILTDNTPEGGTIQIYLYNYDNLGLIFTNVVIATSAIELKTIRLQLDSENIVTENENSTKIFWSKRKPRANFYSTKFDFEKTLDSFFDINGVPINSELIFSDDNGIQVKDIIQFFQEESSQSYKFELSKIDIFKCEYIATKKRKFRAICEFTREEIYYTKISDGEGGYLPPEPDSGWFNTGILEPSNSDRLLWVRTPFNGLVLPWVKGAINTGTWRTYNMSFGYSDCISSKKQYPVDANSTIEISNAIEFRELVRKVYTETHESLRGKQVYSNFLWNDALSPSEESAVYLNNSTSTNYVTMTDELNNDEPANELNKILAIHTYELTTVASNDEDKTILKTTFSDLMNDLLALFPQCYWFIDSDKNWHFEHVKYYDRINTAKNLTEPQYDYLGLYENWEYVKDKLFSREEFEFNNSGYADFWKSDLTFDKIVTNKRGQDIRNEVQAQIITTDVQYCIENRNSLDGGIILVLYDTVDGDNLVRYGIGQKSRKSVINGDLSIATLLAKYATYEGTWTEGKINNQGFWNKEDTYKYQTTKHIRQGSELTIKGVFLDKVIYTNLGLGIVNQRKIDYENSNTKITAIYRYSDNFPIVGSGDNPIDAELASFASFPFVSVVSSDVEVKINIASDGGAIVTERGVVWGTGTEPTVLDNKEIDGAGIGTYFTDFVVVGDGIYYVRGYAINAVGTSYGVSKQFIINNGS